MRSYYLNNQTLMLLFWAWMCDASYCCPRSLAALRSSIFVGQEMVACNFKHPDKLLLLHLHSQFEYCALVIARLAGFWLTTRHFLFRNPVALYPSISISIRRPLGISLYLCASFGHCIKCVYFIYPHLSYVLPRVGLPASVLPQLATWQCRILWLISG